MTLFIFVAATLWAGAWSAVLPPAPPRLADEVGVVAEYRPAAGRFVFERAGERVPVRIGTVVHAGDRVSLPAGAAIVVQLGSGTPLVLERDAIVNAAPALGRLAAFFKSIPGLFDDEFRQARTAASRGTGRCDAGGLPGAPLEVPLLVTGASIVAGTRDLPLVWRGGCAPYMVTLRRGVDTVAFRRGIELGQIRLDAIVLRPGSHEMVLVDGAGHRFEASITVVAALPALPTEIATDGSELVTIAQAVWLSQQDGGRWRFDSFERLRPLVRAGNPLAGAIADGLLWGRRDP